MNIHTLYHPFLKYFRTKRMRQFCKHFSLSTQTRVLDVGGYEFNWSLVPARPQLTILNLSLPGVKGNATWLIADGRHLPFKNGAFDIVYGNSVIEHLGNLESQHLFATECQRVGLCYYIQTPNKYFLIEPHLITPFIHWLPRNIQRHLLRNFTVWGLITRPTEQYCDKFMNEILLLDEKELGHLFPDATIWHERVLGLTKSLIAVRDRSLHK